VDLLDDRELERSAVVANNQMNRLRGVNGVNCYDRELGFDPLITLRDHAARTGTASWLDLCCGSGRALIEAALATPAELRLVGVDLVDFFDAHDGGVQLIAASILRWSPSEPFALITCVHGLHYVGDKLGALARTLRWLDVDGSFYGHLDLANLKGPNGASIAPVVRASFRHASVGYDARRRLVSCTGPRDLDFGLTYLRADDRAGPNFTGQPAVDSYYGV
jgi:SAM-dependent methyltransferase